MERRVRHLLDGEIRRCQFVHHRLAPRTRSESSLGQEWSELGQVRAEQAPPRAAVDHREERRNDRDAGLAALIRHRGEAAGQRRQLERRDPTQRVRAVGMEEVVLQVDQ